MWRRVTVDASIDHPVERVFAYLADPESWPRFVPAVIHRRRIDDGPIEIGSRWEATDRIILFDIHFTDELAEIEPPNRVVWLSTAPWNSRVEYACQADGDGTRVHATYEGDIGGWMRLIAWLPGPIVAWILAKDFKRLGKLLATQEAAGQS